MVPAKLLERLGLAGMVDRLMTEPGSSRGYRNGIVFDTFMPAFHEGAQCLEDVRRLHRERSLMELMGFESLSRSATLGSRLRRAGKHRPSRDALEEVVARYWRRPGRPGSCDPGHRCLGGACEEEDRKAHPAYSTQISS